MWANSQRKSWFIGLATGWILSLEILVAAVTPLFAKESVTTTRSAVAATSTESAEPAWLELASVLERTDVHVWLAGERLDAAGECFVITHGLGGTADGDRFHRLAAAIHKQFPQASLLRIDWSGPAAAKLGGFPHIWKVAGSIDGVGDRAAQVLSAHGMDPARTTFIGESFGNWVNARIAGQFGGVRGILALNPASEAGGYHLPDLRTLARQSWSFHTYSVFDTTHEIAASDFWLETPANSNPLSQHVAGITWLASRLEAGDPSWLQMDKPLPQRRAGHFQAIATQKGNLLDLQLPRERPNWNYQPQEK